jgi:hypothetical protein
MNGGTKTASKVEGRLAEFPPATPIEEEEEENI